MAVVNVRVKYVRPLGYENLKEWTLDPNNVYIGRKGIVFVDGERFPKFDSTFANPYKLSNNLSREKALELYSKLIDLDTKDREYNSSYAGSGIDLSSLPRSKRFHEEAPGLWDEFEEITLKLIEKGNPLKENNK